MDLVRGQGDEDMAVDSRRNSIVLTDSPSVSGAHDGGTDDQVLVTGGDECVLVVILLAISQGLLVRW